MIDSYKSPLLRFSVAAKAIVLYGRSDETSVHKTECLGAA
uniref:Uncharacterized protein n=1 Tax=Siphoviridae sp. ct96x5 TaxID=2825367 RepID=A0A8S5PRZ4_9CAUD|nr:MAG TPA: hypothetical protein [Siphoviridae sp. ct96x5]